jgi:hypothetical protein
MKPGDEVIYSDRTLTADEFAELETGVAPPIHVGALAWSEGPPPKKCFDMPRILPAELHHSWQRVSGILVAMTAVVVAVIMVLIGQYQDRTSPPLAAVPSSVTETVTVTPAAVQAASFTEAFQATFSAEKGAPAERQKALFASVKNGLTIPAGAVDEVTQHLSDMGITISTTIESDGSAVTITKFVSKSQEQDSALEQWLYREFGADKFNRIAENCGERLRVAPLGCCFRTLDDSAR